MRMSAPLQASWTPARVAALPELTEPAARRGTPSIQEGILLGVAGRHPGHHHTRVPWDHSCLSFPHNSTPQDVSLVPANERGERGHDVS